MKTLSILRALLLVAPTDAYAGAVVAHAESGYAEMDAEQVKRVFLGRETAINGKPVVLVYQKGGAARERFDQDVVGRPGAQLTSYWSKLIFTGKARAPEEVANDAEVVARLTSNPNAIGYVGALPDSPSLKVLFKF